MAIKDVVENANIKVEKDKKKDRKVKYNQNPVKNLEQFEKYFE